MSWPIFTAGRIQWNIELQRAVAEQDLAAYEQTILSALKDVETALVAYAKDQERIRSLTVAVANNRSAVELSTSLYVAGKSDFLNVLVAQRSLNISEEALVLNTPPDNKLIALYKALGGGWEKEGLPPECGKAKQNNSTGKNIISLQGGRVGRLLLWFLRVSGQLVYNALNKTVSPSITGRGRSNLPRNEPVSQARTATRTSSTGGSKTLAWLVYPQTLHGAVPAEGHGKLPGGFAQRGGDGFDHGHKLRRPWGRW